MPQTCIEHSYRAKDKARDPAASLMISMTSARCCLRNRQAPIMDLWNLLRKDQQPLLFHKPKSYKHDTRLPYSPCQLKSEKFRQDFPRFPPNRRVSPKEFLPKNTPARLSWLKKALQEVPQQHRLPQESPLSAQKPHLTHPPIHSFTHPPSDNCPINQPPFTKHPASRIDLRRQFSSVFSLTFLRQYVKMCVCLPDGKHDTPAGARHSGEPHVSSRTKIGVSLSQFSAGQATTSSTWKG